MENLVCLWAIFSINFYSSLFFVLFFLYIFIVLWNWAKYAGFASFIFWFWLVVSSFICLFGLKFSLLKTFFILVYFPSPLLHLLKILFLTLIEYSLFASRRKQPGTILNTLYTFTHLIINFLTIFRLQIRPYLKQKQKTNKQKKPV